MTKKISLHELQTQLLELLDHVVETGDEYVIQRDGKDSAVIVSARQWRRRRVGQRLDRLGPAYRLDRAKHARTEELLAAKQQRPLSAAERRELKAVLQESEAILLRRAAALDRLL